MSLRSVWQRWDAEIVTLVIIVAAAALVGSQSSCAVSTATPELVRAPSPGVAPYPHPAHWIEPAVLCVGGTQHRWAGSWSCIP